MTTTNTPGEVWPRTIQTPVAHHHLCRFDRSRDPIDRIMFASVPSRTCSSNGGTSARCHHSWRLAFRTHASSMGRIV